jgi:hypothetical protein
LVFFVPEILAAWKSVDAWLPFTTFSGMVGHLEVLHPAARLLTCAVIVLLLVGFLQALSRRKAVTPGHLSVSDGGADDGASPRRTARPANPFRTPADRLTFRPPKRGETAATLDFETKPVGRDDIALFFLASLLVCALIAGGTYMTRHWWPDNPRMKAPSWANANERFHAGYVLYGSIVLFWFLVPSLIALVGRRDVPFPTLFSSAADLRQRLHARHEAGGPAGSFVASLFVYVIIAGLVVLMFHLLFYPFPDIRLPTAK